MNDALLSSKTNEWSTPKDLYEDLNDVFKFSLDPCATAENKKCDKYYDINADGLSKSWACEKVFMNPPYGRGVKDWIKKALTESLKGATVVCLIPARPDTEYWHSYIFGKADVYFIKGRLKFGDAESPAPFPSAIIVYGSKEKVRLSERKYYCITARNGEYYG